MAVMPYFQDDTLTLLEGHAARVLATMDAGSVDCAVTSPPYFGLRDYGGQPEQIGAEGNPADYVSNLLLVLAEVRRVLAEDGTLWLNLGDSYAYPPGSAGRQGDGQRKGRTFTAEGLRGTRALPPKNLLGIPWRVVFALQEAGWYLRNAIVWNKPNAMPESVRDRLSTRYELLFLLTKNARYWFDLDPIREPHGATADRVLSARGPQPEPGRWAAGAGAGNRHRASDAVGVGRNSAGRNPGDVWSINTRPFPEAHFATFPIELPRRCILAGCKPGGTVLDPFAGAGTALLAAQQLGRRAVGIELHPDYLKMALRRCQDAPLFTDTGEVSA
jgi:DNA modification methylase